MSLRAILGFREKVFQDDLRVKSLSSSKNMDKTFIQFSGKKTSFHLQVHISRKNFRKYVIRAGQLS